MQINIDLTYRAPCGGTVDIPEVTSWDQIKEWYVKWGVFYYSLDGKNFHSVDVSGQNEISTKRPIQVQIANPQDGTIYCEVDGNSSEDVNW